jgi:hypothetical protein
VEGKLGRKKEEVVVEEKQRKLRFEGFPDEGSVSSHPGAVKNPFLRFLQWRHPTSFRK